MFPRGHRQHQRQHDEDSPHERGDTRAAARRTGGDGRRAYPGSCPQGGHLPPPSSKDFEDQIRSGRVAALALPGATPLQGGVPISVGGKVVRVEAGMAGATNADVEWPVAAPLPPDLADRGE